MVSYRRTLNHSQISLIGVKSKSQENYFRVADPLLFLNNQLTNHSFIQPINQLFDRSIRWFIYLFAYSWILFLLPIYPHPHPPPPTPFFPYTHSTAIVWFAWLVNFADMLREFLKFWNHHLIFEDFRDDHNVVTHAPVMTKKQWILVPEMCNAYNFVSVLVNKNTTRWPSSWNTTIIALSRTDSV